MFYFNLKSFNETDDSFFHKWIKIKMLVEWENLENKSIKIQV